MGMCQREPQLCQHGARLAARRAWQRAALWHMTSRPTLHELQDDALLQAALRRYSAQQPPARSAWTYRLALLGFLLGGAAFVMEAVSLSGGVGLSVAEPAAASVAEATVRKPRRWLKRVARSMCTRKRRPCGESSGGVGARNGRGSERACPMNSRRKSAPATSSPASCGKLRRQCARQSALRLVQRVCSRGIWTFYSPDAPARVLRTVGFAQR